MGNGFGNTEDLMGIVKQFDDVPMREVTAGTATSTQELIGATDGAENFSMRRFVMGVGGGMPRHTNSVEHEQYVLKGRGRVTIGDEVHEVATGNVLFIPAHTPHSYEVLEAPFEFLCLVPNQEDQIVLLEGEC